MKLIKIKSVYKSIDNVAFWLGSKVRYKVYSQFKSCVDNKVYSQVLSIVFHPINSNVKLPLYHNIRDQVNETK